MFKKLNQATAKPKIWSAYTADVLWTDEHIAKQMLGFHLNPDLALASRSFAFIDASVDWLISETKLNEKSQTIDFGCGPGLYTERLKAKGVGTVVGVDFSTNSLNYARKQAEQAGLDIEYHHANYLEFDDTRKFDLITLVMCDLCALSPAQRATLLGKFKTLLAANGVIALDVYSKTRFDKQSESIALEKNAMQGFWSEQDYWSIRASFTYAKELVTLDKYVISQEQKDWQVYNWLQHFTLDMLEAELALHGLKIKQAYSDLQGTAFADGEEFAVIIEHS